MLLVYVHTAAGNVIHIPPKSFPLLHLSIGGSNALRDQKVRKKKMQVSKQCRFQHFQRKSSMFYEERKI